MHSAANNPQVDKWADYEDEIQQLRTENTHANTNASSLEPPRRNSGVPFDDRATSPNTASNLQNRLSSFLGARKSTANLKAPDTPTTNELEEALKKEQSLRQAAEGKLDEASGELEELSAQLFMQANEMVATERKARAKLEERVELLEKRDGEKRKRLERLEGAMARIERVRGLLGVPET